MHERPWRLSSLLDVIYDNDFNMRKLWPLVEAVWSDTESVHANIEHWQEIWAMDCPYRYRAMCKSERAVFRRLPPEIVVWRGVSDKGAIDGMSWTLNRRKAEWFARRWSGEDGPILAEGIIPKD